MTTPRAAAAPLAAASAVLLLVACSRAPQEPAPAPTPRDDNTAWQGTFLEGGNAASLRRYLAAAPQITPQKFEAEPDPRTIVFDREATIRAIRSISPDGVVVVLDAAVPQVRDITAGRILWMWNLLLSKVDSVVQIEDRVYLLTRPAPLTEAFRNLDLQMEVPVNLARGFPTIAPHSPDPAPAAARAVQPYRGGLLPVLYGAEPAAPGAEAAPEEPAADSNAEWSGVEFTGSARNFTFTVGYAPRPSGLQVELEARYGTDGTNSSDPSKRSTTAGMGKKQLEKQSAEREQARKELKDLLMQREELERVRLDDLPHWDDLRKLDFNNRYPKLKQELLAKIAEANRFLEGEPGTLGTKVKEKLWDIVSENVDVRLRAVDEVEHFSAVANIKINDSKLVLCQLTANGFKAKAKLTFVGRLGQAGQQNIKVPVMELPFSFNVPVPVGGVPFVFHIGVDFSLTVSLTGKHATIFVEGESSIGGNPGFKYSTEGSSYGGTLAGDQPVMKDPDANSVGVSALVAGFQVPRVGFGLGVIGASTIVYIDAVHVLTSLNSASAAIGLAGLPCKRFTYDVVGHVGIQTQVLPGILGEGLVSKVVNEKLSPKHEIGRAHVELLRPPVKGCEIQ